MAGMTLKFSIKHTIILPWNQEIPMTIRLSTIVSKPSFITISMGQAIVLIKSTIAQLGAMIQCAKQQ